MLAVATPVEVIVPVRVAIVPFDEIWKFTIAVAPFGK